MSDDFPTKILDAIKAVSGSLGIFGLILVCAGGSVLLGMQLGLVSATALNGAADDYARLACLVGSGLLVAAIARRLVSYAGKLNEWRKKAKDNKKTGIQLVQNARFLSPGAALFLYVALLQEGGRIPSPERIQVVEELCRLKFFRDDFGNTVFIPGHLLMLNVASPLVDRFIEVLPILKQKISTKYSIDFEDSKAVVAAFDKLVADALKRDRHIV